jgi:hypothetical protein
MDSVLEVVSAPKEIESLLSGEEKKDIESRKFLIGPFSKSLINSDPMPQEMRTRIDELLMQKLQIKDEDELEDYIETLPEEISIYADKISLYLRYRDIIIYTDIDLTQAMFLYSTIHSYCKPSLKRVLKEFFNPEVTTFRVLPIIKGLTLLAENKPMYAMICLTLINYIVNEMPDEDISTENISIEKEPSHLEVIPALENCSLEGEVFC